MRRKLSILTMVLVAGCQPSPLTRLATTPDAASSLGAPELPAVARTGTLAFTVKWPERSYTGFSAQAIPLSTNALKLVVMDAQDVVVATEILARTSGTLPVTRNVTLREGTGYVATVRAYAEVDPTEQSSVIALGTARDLEVAWGRQLPVHLTLGPLFAPTLTALSSANAARGATLELQGTLFDRGATAPVVVFPSGLQATASLASGRLRLVVPQGAGSGNLGVKVDGIAGLNTLPFRELRTLGLAATASFERLENDGAFHSWIGDTLDLQGTGTDETGQGLASPSIEAYFHATGTVADLQGRAYTPLTLGTDEVGARAGALQATRSVLVTPMAGATVVASSPGAVASDVSACMVGDRLLVAWYVPTDHLISWRFLNADGSLDPTVHSVASTGLVDERSVRVACTGTTACIAYRSATNLTVDGTPKLHETLKFNELDMVTGAIRTDAQGSPLTRTVLIEAPDNRYYLDGLHAVGTQYLLTFIRWTGSYYQRKLLAFGFAADGTLSSDFMYGYGDTTYLVPSYQDDSAAVMASGSQAVAAQTFNFNGQVIVVLTVHRPDGSLLLQQGYVWDKARGPVLASDGTDFLLVTLEAGADSSYVKACRINSSLGIEGTASTVANLGMTSPGAVNYPLSLAWDGQQYRLSYVRKIVTTVNGQTKLVAQPMVQALSRLGTAVGDPYPMADQGHTASLPAGSAGEWGLWLSGNKDATLRRIKYR